LAGPGSKKELGPVFFYAILSDHDKFTEGMALCNQQFDPAPLAPVLEKYQAGLCSLITVLQQAQELYGWLSPGLLGHVARATGQKPAKLMGVATFYAQFRLQPAGKYPVLLCKGTACHVNGAESIAAALSEEAGAALGATSADGLFSLDEVACLGCCSLSPVMTVNGETYGSLTPQGARAVLRDLRAQEQEA
jgi:NADH-quinone oxidoreductase subunit E